MLVLTNPTKVYVKESNFLASAKNKKKDSINIRQT